MYRELVWLCSAALAAGAVNSVAGGGTLLTFPALLAGLSLLGAADAAVVANATSTMALVPGSLAGAWGYHREMKRARRWLYLLVGPSLAGGVIGALLLTRLDPAYFAALVPWLVLTAALLFLAESFLPSKNPADSRQRPLSAGAVVGILVFQLVVAVYGGYFGAGASILVLSALAALGVGDVNQMNALKTVLISCINGISVVVFIAEQKVAWRYALPMTAAAILGGYLGARLALIIQPRYTKSLIAAIGLGLAAYFFLRVRTRQDVHPPLLAMQGQGQSASNTVRSLSSAKQPSSRCFMLAPDKLKSVVEKHAGIIDKQSKYAVDQTVDRLKDTLKAKGITLFAMIDHSGEAEKVGMKMRATKLLIFGSPKAGTPLMLAAPRLGLDLPLKILVWEDREGKVWLSYNCPEYLKERYGLPQDLLQKVAVVDTLAAKAGE